VPGIDVMICRGAPGQLLAVFMRLMRRGRQRSVVARSRQHLELLATADGRATVVHTEFAVDVLSVRPHRAQRHHELAGDFGALQVRGEQAKHVVRVRSAPRSTLV
jgi:hypothetical protein